MKIDLFSTALFNHKTDDFGIIDNEPAAVVSYDNGIAKVENCNNYDVYFIPLDKSIECLRPDGSAESQCDVLLICIRPENKYDFYFVELKNVGDNWISNGKDQLKTTILNFKKSYNISCLSKKTAFLANKRRPRYHYESIHIELMERFKVETGFRLNICATIPVK